MNIKQLGLSTSAFSYSMGSAGKNTERQNPKPWTLEEFIDFAASCGFGGVEAPLMRFVPDLDRERINTLKERLAKREMFFIMDAEKPLDEEEIRTLMPYAREFGSSIIRIKSSNILCCERKKIGKPWQEHIDACIAALKRLTPELKEHGLKIAIENHQDLDSNDLRKIIEAVGPDIAGATFDIGNAFSVCETPESFAQKLGSKIINVHIKDYKIFKSGKGFRLSRCSIGDGAVDFKLLLPLIAKSSQNAKMVVELGALEAREIAWLQPDFWDEIEPRTDSELKAFSQSLGQAMIDDSRISWQTPWETGAPRSEVQAYEVSQLEASLSYLKNL